MISIPYLPHASFLEDVLGNTLLRFRPKCQNVQVEPPQRIHGPFASSTKTGDVSWTLCLLYKSINFIEGWK